jgi:hypothetical protein
MRPDIIPDYVSRNHTATKNYTLRRSPRIIGDIPMQQKVTFTNIQGPRTSTAWSRIISQQVLNALTLTEALSLSAAFSPSKLTMSAFVDTIPNYAHYASPMVHSTTGETITSYKRLMHDPTTA